MVDGYSRSSCWSQLSPGREEKEALAGIPGGLPLIVIAYSFLPDCESVKGQSDPQIFGVEWSGVEVYSFEVQYSRFGGFLKFLICSYTF